MEPVDEVDPPAYPIATGPEASHEPGPEVGAERDGCTGTSMHSGGIPRYDVEAELSRLRGAS